MRRRSLKERRRAQAEADRAARAATLRLRTKLFVAAVASVAALTLFRLDLGGNASNVDEMPDELIGTWVTDEPRYADRAVSITATSVRLGLGGGATADHPIVTVNREVGPVHRLYRIEYEGDAGPEVMELFVYDDATMTFRNPSEVRWHRSSR